jgi:4'-phosphopantetheinyl transferase
MPDDNREAYGAFPSDPQIGMHDVHVVRLQLERSGDLAAYAALLDGDERQRARRLVLAGDRRRFIVAHAMMRVTLARYLDRPAKSLRFTPNANGKPQLVGHCAALRFNLSHSGELALLAIARRRDVGVDIEKQHPIDTLEVSRQFFAPNEQSALASFTESERLTAFFRCWTRKESFIKALGVGLTFSLKGFEVSLTPTGSQLLLSCSTAPAELVRWRIVSLPIDDGYAAALTVGVDHRRIFTWKEPFLSS